VREQPKKIAGLDVLEFSQGEGTPCVVLLHGFGANFLDLAPLSQVVATERKLSWVFPNAPLEVPLGIVGTGRAWFPLDVSEFERAAMAGTHPDFSPDTPHGFLEMSETVGRFLSELERKYRPLYVGGFSQGAMVACDAVLSRESNAAGLLLLSGNLVARERWERLAQKHRRLRVFQSHGTHDTLLSPRGAKALHDLLARNGLDCEFHEFPGGHEIPTEILSKLSRFLVAESPGT